MTSVRRRRQPPSTATPTRAARRAASSSRRRKTESPNDIPPIAALVAEIRATRQLLANLDELSDEYGSLFDVVASVVRSRLDVREAALAAAQSGQPKNLLWFVTRERSAEQRRKTALDDADDRGEGR